MQSSPGGFPEVEAAQLDSETGWGQLSQHLHGSPELKDDISQCRA